MNLLITGAWPATDEDIALIEQFGHTIALLKSERDTMPVPYESIEGIICNGLFLYHPIEKFTNLRYIQLTSAGYDRVPMDYVKEHKIAILNARGVYSIPMAEYAVSGVLQLYKQSRFFYENQKQQVWKKQRDLLELFGKSVCIVGCGSIGTECAKRFAAFGCRILGIDTFPRNDENYEVIRPLSDLDVTLPIADIVILALPLTKETHHLFDEKRFQTLKKDSILVNISRGAVVDSVALNAAVNHNILSGAVLDVFEQEPWNETSPLWSMENIVITPHNSYVGDGNSHRLSELICKNLRNS